MTGQEFKSLREAKGYSRRELAAYIGRHRNTIRYWETGRSPVPKLAADWLSEAQENNSP